MLGWGLAALLVALAVALAPLLAAPYVSARLSAHTGVQVRIGWISWNPFAGRITLHDVALAPGSEAPPVVTCGAIKVNIALGRWLAGEIVLDGLVVTQPWVGRPAPQSSPAASSRSTI